MDVEILSRIQFALTIGFHYLFPPLSIGLGLCIVIMEGMYLKTKNRLYEEITKFWVKIFALIFALGVATGVVMVFAFGNNWANYSRFVGDVFGSILGAEGVFAFFMEAGFLSILLFGWNRVSPKVHFISTIFVALGAHFSAVWIVFANSWMQTPAGFEIVGQGASAHAVIADIWQVVFNPSSFDRLQHVLVGCWLAGSFLVVSISAFYVLRRKFLPHAIASLKVGVVVAVSATVLQFFTGDSSARLLATTQPAKLAAFEGIFKTQAYAPLSIVGFVDTKDETLTHSIGIPGLLSLLTYGDFATPIKGLEEFPKEDRPNAAIVFQTYHIMVAMWSIMVLSCIVAIYAWKKRWQVGKWPLRFLVLSVFLPQVANQAGWFSAEIGRQPWLVYGVLRTSEGLSRSVSAGQVLGSIIMFGSLYLILFILFIYLLNNKIQHGPTLVEDEEPTYQKNPLLDKGSGNQDKNEGHL
ncbi:MAG: cytochrome ubiquinol oxidase subunit I [Chlamydiales bacterium]|nr:cytochrome ubiquinol oxidase subunit I [Chlamydiales bacterium]